MVKGEDYAGVDPSDVGFEADANFALIYGSGSVVSGRGRTSRTGAPVFASQTVSEAIESAAEDPDIAAIILRIDSPGGSPLASEEIWYASRKAKEAGKPLIASFSDVAASGGYYAAMGCDAIVAPPGALTGSIGVFVLRPVLTGLFEKLGIGITGLTRGQHADLLLSGELSPGARQRLRAIVTDTYDLFVTRVAEGRELPRERVDALGQGRVWTGAQAADLGLVDELGGLHVAVDRAKRELGLDEDAEVLLLPFPKPRQLADEIRDLLQGRASLDLIRAIVLPDLVERLGSWSWVLELPTNTPLLVPPFLVDIR
ncbi:MAG: signal peptide peptidase SppA [Proteobacteria bacterium]|nr:signal peptide peptidase SppA [Pseudomonadota bacterium]